MHTEQKQKLAITSIPMQQWTTLYNDGQGLYVGTIFPELDLPFFMANDPYPGPMQTSDDKSNLLHQIDCVSFALYDLILYLDTHPDCENGLKLYHEKAAQRKQLVEQFTNTYYPLTQNCIPDSESKTHYYNWEDGPMPWEGGC